MEKICRLSPNLVPDMLLYGPHGDRRCWAKADRAVFPRDSAERQRDTNRLGSVLLDQGQKESVSLLSL